jgi:hypothetical protein
MYQTVDGTLVITVNDWCRAGLTYKQFNHDGSRGYLSVFRRGIHGNTMIDVKSIRRPERLRVIESAFGKIELEGPKSIFAVELDTAAREYFITKCRKPDGSPLDPEQIKKYTNRASLLEGIKRGLEKHRTARAKAGRRVNMGEFWKDACDWYLDQLKDYPCAPVANTRVLERIFKQYLNEGYSSIAHKNIGNDGARVVSAKAERLFQALWRTSDHPFVNRVHELYLEFVSGTRELYDQSTGEIFKPEEFKHKGRAQEVSIATIRNYLKDIVNETSTYSDRNGNFDYVNKKRPKHQRHVGKYTLSKITMDDVALSRVSVRGWVYKYIAVDVVSGYWFRPAYIVGKPTVATVVESLRNMFCELTELGLPIPGELETEHHLIKDMPFLGNIFPFTRLCSSATEKRAEHKIREFKYGISKDNGHTRGRWYAKHEAYKSVRNKVNGDYVEPKQQPQAIVADDLSDVEQHNNELHPLQKTYPGMTRRDVLLSNINPILKPIEHWYLYQYIGNETETSIYNNDYCPVQGENFELTDYACLNRLKPNNVTVTAYWLPEPDGSINKVYLYQGDTYIGEAVNKAQFEYNENAIERTDQDRANMLHQNKRCAKFDKFIKDRRAEIPYIGTMKTSDAQILDSIDTEIIEGEQPEGYEEDEFTTLENTDWGAIARMNL